MSSQISMEQLELTNSALTKELNSLKAQLLQNDAKTRNQVMSAKLKLNSMADAINQIFADMADVHAELNKIMPSSDIILKEKGSAHSEAIMSTVGCTEDVPVLFASDLLISQNLNLPSTVPSLKCSSCLPDAIQDSNENLLVNTQMCESERCEVSASLIPVVLVADNGRDVQDAVEKDLSNIERDRSFASELDIDLSCSSQKNSPSRPQAHLSFSLCNKTMPRTSSDSLTKSLQSGEKGLSPVEATSLEDKSTFFESEALRYEAASSSRLSHFEMKETAVKNVSPGVISPPLQDEEVLDKASHSRNHSLTKVIEVLPEIYSHMRLLASVANKTLLLSEEMEITLGNENNFKSMLESFVENNDWTYKFPKVPSRLLSKTLLLNESMSLSREVATHLVPGLEDDKRTSTELSKERMIKEKLVTAESTSSMDVKGGNAGDNARPKRKTKSVNYKEASLKKKMRR